MIKDISNPHIVHLHELEYAKTKEKASLGGNCISCKFAGEVLEYHVRCSLKKKNVNKLAICHRFK